MNDYIVRATAGNAQIRAFAAVTTNLVEEAREHHGTSPVATAALGRLLTGGVFRSDRRSDCDSGQQGKCKRIRIQSGCDASGEERKA